jgi:hypothetical protein
MELHKPKGDLQPNYHHDHCYVIWWQQPSCYSLNPWWNRAVYRQRRPGCQSLWSLTNNECLRPDFVFDRYVTMSNKAGERNERPVYDAYNNIYVKLAFMYLCESQAGLLCDCVHCPLPLVFLLVISVFLWMFIHHLPSHRRGIFLTKGTDW